MGCDVLIPDHCLSILFTPYDCLFISVAFVVLSCVGCLWVTGV